MHASPPRPSFSGWRVAAVLVLVLAATVAAYGPALHGEFVFDDKTSVVDQVDLKDLTSYLGSSFWLRTQRGGLSRPVTELTFALNYALSGFDTFSYHLLSLGLHLIAVLLVLAFTREILARAGWRRTGPVALAVAGAFALHPLQSQAVAYIAQRSEVLASVFYLAALVLLLRAEARHGTLRGVALYLAATAAFLAGLGSKIIIVTLPVTYIAIHLWFPERPPGPTRGRALLLATARVLPWLVIGAVPGYLSLRGVEGRGDAGFSIPGLPAPTYLLTQASVVLRYIGLVFLPAGQNVDHDLAPASLGDPAALLSVAALLVIAAGAWYGWRRPARDRMTPDAAAAARIASFGVLWFFLLLAPTSSLVPLVDLMMEHRVYLASWGLLTAALVGCSLALDRLLPAGSAPAIAAAATACLWVSLGAALHARTAVWGSALALWSDVVAKSPAKARGHVNLGVARLERGDVAGATAAQERALVLAPRDAVLLNSIAIRLLDQGRIAEAEQRAREAILADPGDGAGYNTLGEIALKRGDAAAAVALFRDAVRHDGEGTPSRLFNLALALERADQAEEACRVWARYLLIEGSAADRAEAREHAASRGCQLR